MRKNDDLSYIKAAIKISKQKRFEKNSKRINYAITKGAELVKRMEDLEFVSRVSDNELQNSDSQSEKELFSKNTLEDEDLLPPHSEEPNKGEIIPNN